MLAFRENPDLSKRRIIIIFRSLLSIKNKINILENLGYALVMDLASLTITELRNNILKVAASGNNPFRKAARRRSILMKDVPIDTKNLAVWWVEHVARHKGAEHLKSTTR
jgi:hypothetical protein